MGIDAAYGIGSLKPGVCTSTTRPASPFEGQVIFETDTDRLYVYNGTAWVIPNSPAQNPQGLELITTVTCTSGGTASGGIVTVGSAVASVTVSNAFSATYDAYEILYTAGVSSNTEVLYMTLSGNTGANYYSAGAQNTSGSGAYNGIGAAGVTRFQVATCTTTSFGLTITVHNTFLAKQTYGRCNFVSDYSSGWTGHVNNNPISSTGFTFLPGAGTLTGGNITVYGYRKS
jgi:hypothetical protein